MNGKGVSYLGGDLDEVDSIIVVSEVQVEHTFFVGNLVNLHVELFVDFLDFLPGSFRVNLEDVKDNGLLIRRFNLVNKIPLFILL